MSQSRSHPDAPCATIEARHPSTRSYVARDGGRWTGRDVRHFDAAETRWRSEWPLDAERTCPRISCTTDRRLLCQLGRRATMPEPVTLRFRVEVAAGGIHRVRRARKALVAQRRRPRPVRHDERPRASMPIVQMTWLRHPGRLPLGRTELRIADGALLRDEAEDAGAAQVIGPRPAGRNSRSPNRVV